MVSAQKRQRVQRLRRSGRGAAAGEGSAVAGQGGGSGKPELSIGGVLVHLPGQGEGTSGGRLLIKPCRS